MRLQATRTYMVDRELPLELEGLKRLARNYYWSWTAEVIALFEQLDPRLWQETYHNPVRLLQLVDHARLEHAAGDRAYVTRVADRVADFDTYCARPRVLEGQSLAADEVVAYFSFEFALTESLPAYSGGLGVLAGDHLKSASDLALPLVGVGLLYREGYFQQVFAPDGWQTEEYHEIDPAQHALEQLRDERGEPLRITVEFPGRQVVCHIWRADVGTVPLYLLDSDVEENSAEDRLIAARLYGGDIETRIQQEMLLGIGGVRALHALGLRPVVCHMNEGHSSFLGIERVREIMRATGTWFGAARIPVTASTAFTTHTPVAAGIDLFGAELMRRYLGHYSHELGIDEQQLFGLGRIRSDDESEPFSMALLGLRLSGFRNGVSRVHGEVSRKLWATAWPALPDGHAPITSITNGVHLPTWVSRRGATLYDEYLGRQWRDDPVTGTDWTHLASVPDEVLWNVHSEQRRELVARAKVHHRETAARAGRSLNEASLDPEALTIGFARRFASYKRAALLFRDLDRLCAILNSADRPVQFVFAGKAHPRDEAAKELIREVVEHSRRPELRHRLVVLERYDVDLARSLVQGCDVWLNTPLRPLEASGTSGMKAVANGALHMSVLDGWWNEAYQPGLGWAVGRDRPDDAAEIQDAFDAESIYELLENEVVPLFYDRQVHGIPSGWVAAMKASIAAHAPVFSTQRMVMEYAQRAYAPGVRAWRRFQADGIAPAADLAGWLDRVREGWSTLKVLSVEDDARAVVRERGEFNVTVQAHWGTLSHQDLRLDVFNGAADSRGHLASDGSAPLTLINIEQDGVCRYGGTVSPRAAGRGGYRIRVTPDHPALGDLADSGLALWA